MIYDNIRTICKKKNISIKQVERELGFSNSSICKWNECEPSVWKVQKVADYLGVTMEYLLADQKESAWGPQGWIGGKTKVIFQSVQLNNGKILDGDKIGELVAEIVNKFSENGLSCDEAKIILERTKAVLGEFSTIQKIS